MTNALRFDAESHTYWLGSRKVPGVTTVLKPLYDWSMVDPEVLAAKAALGTAVHLCTELYDADDLDDDTVMPEWRPYLDGWVKFREETGFVPTRIETRVFHPGLFYAGTLDRTGILFDAEAMLDIKTSATMSPAVGCQTAAYLRALTAAPDYEGPQDMKRYSVQLKPDGTYKLHEYNDPTDWPTFVSLLTVRNWTEKHGVQAWN